MKQKAFLCIAILCSLTALFRCGGLTQPKPAPSLNIVYLNVDEDLPLESLTAIQNEFAQQHQGLVVNATTETIAPDESFASILEKFRQTDVVVYPSKLLSTLEPRANSFYPVSATDTPLNKGFLTHFQSPSGEGLWSLPIGIDPIVMLIQKQAVRKTGDEFFPRAWNNILIVSELCATDNNYAYPHLTVYDSKGYGLTDTLAGFYLSRGLFYDVVTGKGLSSDMETHMHELTQYSILQTLPVYMTGDRNSVEFSFKTAKTVQELKQAQGLFTFIRYSDYMQMPKETQDQYFMGIAPNPYDEIPVLCYSIHTSVSLESNEPEIAKEFVTHLSKQKGLDTGKKYLSIHELQTVGFIPESSFLVIRSNSKTVHEKAYFDCLQQKSPTLDFSRIWLSAFTVIHEKSL